MSSNSTVEISASSVQSMLKTTTEIDDIGLLPRRPSSRPSRPPLSDSQRLRRRSSFLLAPSNDKYPRTDGSWPSRSLQHRQFPHGIPRKDIANPGFPSKRQRYRPDGSGNWSLYNQSYGPRYGPGSRLYSRRSSATLRSHDYTSRFLSQTAHPDSIQDQGHRAVSPAYSEAQAYNPRYPFNRTPSLASSPSSSFYWQSTHRGSGYNTDCNHSTPSFASPSPGFSPGYPSVRSSPYPSRTVTPVSLRLPSPPTVPMQGYDTAFRMQRSPSTSSTPVYYDYSETFGEDGHFFSRQDLSLVSLPFNLEETIHEHGPPPVIRQAQTPFGTVPGSMFVPSELPTEVDWRDNERKGEDLTSQVPTEKMISIGKEVRFESYPHPHEKFCHTDKIFNVL